MTAQARTTTTTGTISQSGTVTLFSTVTAGWPKSGTASTGLRRVALDFKNTRAGLLKVYKSTDRGTNWVQVAQDSVTIPTYTSKFEYLVEGYEDWKVTFTEGGAGSDSFTCDILIGDDRGPSS
jgi:hypothetical protein